MPEQTAQKDFSKLYTPVAIVLAGVIIGGFAMVGLSKMGVATGGGNAAVAEVDIEDVNIEGSPYIGDEDAPVVLAAWADYQCPFCKAVEVGHDQIPTEPSMPTLIKEYVETGKLKIVFKDYAFLSEDSTTGAIWGRAVWDLYPAQYYAWREAMFTAQDEEHGGFGDEASIFALTKTITGIDANAVKTRVGSNSAEYLNLIEADKIEGTNFGIQGTPGFITGKVLLPGAMPLSDFKTAIDAQL